jgi:hypothetical protein
MTEPKFLKPWDNYQAGNILLSFNRINEDLSPKNVIVKSDFDPSILANCKFYIGILVDAIF